MHDLLIRNADILDGTGAPQRPGDLAVAGGRIAAIGRDLGPARETVDADGLALMPGIIDGHTHYDAQITWDPFCNPSPALGVTTVVIGNCGFTIAPCRPADRDLTMRNLTHVEGMSLDGAARRHRLGVRNLPRISRDARASGVGAERRLPSSAIRRCAPSCCGGDAAKRAATDDEIAADGGAS